MSKRPVIGISCYGKAKIPDRYSVPIDYVKAVQCAGGLVVLLPPGEPEVLERVDGLVLAGGGDIDPKHYGDEKRHASLYGLDDERDAFEFGVARHAIARDLPTLAICRGMQVVNVATGGSLHQHLGDDPALHPHRGEGRSVTHVVKPVGGSLLAKITARDTFPVCSEHHQAVKRLGEGMRTVATAEDGTIEAVESAQHPNLLAVQWHPEDTAGEDPTQQALFDWLIATAKSKR